MQISKPKPQWLKERARDAMRTGEELLTDVWTLRLRDISGLE